MFRVSSSSFVSKFPSKFPSKLPSQFSLLGTVLLAAVLGAGLPGCGGSGKSAVTTIPGADGRSIPASLNLPSLHLSITSDKSTYKVGDTIHLTISVTNTDTKTHTVSFPSATQTTWWGYIVGQNGKIVSYEYWPGHNLITTANLGTDTYAAGETHTFAYDFPYAPVGSPPQVSSLPAGTYQIYARYPNATFDAGTLVSNTVPTPASAALTISVTN